MAQVVFNKDATRKATNRMVRFDEDTDFEIEQLAETFNITISEVIRSLTKAGIDLMHEQGAVHE